MKKLNILKLLFYFSYVLLIMQTMCVNIHGFNSVIPITKKIIIINLLMVTIISIEKINIKSIFFIAASLSLGMLATYTTKMSTVFYTIIFILAAKNIDIDEFVRKDFIIKISLMCFTFMCFLIGIADNTIRYRTDGTIRYSLGFPHPNRLGLYIFNLCLDLIYMHYKERKKYDCIFLIVCFIFVGIICDSRASQIGIIILLILYFVLPHIEENKAFNKLISFSPMILFTISFILMYMYQFKSNFIITLDRLFTTRIRCMYEFYSYYKINLFGNFFEFYANNNYSKLTALDNGYMHLIIHYGIIVFLYFNYILQKVLVSVKKEKKYEIYIYVIPILIYGMFERHIFEIEFNTMMLLFSNIIFIKKIDSKNKTSNDIQINNKSIPHMPIYDRGIK